MANDHDLSGEALRTELRALQGAVDELMRRDRQRLTVTVRPLATRPWLGQSVSLRVQVEDGAGLTVPGRQVSAFTTWGILSVDDGVEDEPGRAVTTRTSTDGTLRLAVTPGLPEEQQAAVEAQLDRLPPEAARPSDARAELLELARRYKMDSHRDFRLAADRLADLVGVDADTDTLPQADRWEAERVHVVVQVHGADGRGDVVASAAVTVRLTDWIRPWVDVLQGSMEGSSALDTGVRTAVFVGGGAGRVLGGIYGQINDFVRLQPGKLGANLARRVAGDRVRLFLSEDALELPSTDRATLHQGLSLVTGPRASGSVGLLAGLSRTREELRTVSERVDTSDIESFGTRLAGFEDRLGGVATVDDVAGLRRAISDGLATAATDRQGLRGTLTEGLAGAATNRRRLRGTFTEGLASAATDRAGLRGTLTEVGTDVTDLDSRMGDLATRAEVSRLSLSVDQRLLSTVPQSVFDDYRERVDGRFEGLVPLERFDTFREETLSSLDAKASRSALARLDRKVTTNLSGVVRTSDFDSFRSTVDRRLDKAVDVEMFERVTGNLDTRLGRLFPRPP